MSAFDRGATAVKGLLAVIVVLFSLNTITHDFLCHEELQGVCNPLHWSAVGASPILLAVVPVTPDPLSKLSAAGERDVIPGALPDIFHPPD